MNQNFKSFIILVTFSVCWSTISVSQTQNPFQIGRAESISVKQEFETFTQNKLIKLLNRQAYRLPKEEIAVSALLEFDQKKFEADYKSWLLQKSEKREIYAREKRELLLLLNGDNLKKENIKDKGKDKLNKIEKKSEIEMRLGRLNLDMDPSNLNRILEKSENQYLSTGSSFKLDLEIGDAPGTKLFSYDPIDYITDIKFDIKLSERGAELDQNLLKESLANEIELHFIISKSLISDTKIEILPNSDTTTYLTNLIDPKSPMLGFGVLALAFLGFGIILSGSIKSSFTKIASVLQELKPEESESLGGLEVLDSSQEEEEQAINEESGFGNAEKSRAITAELNLIRENLYCLCEDDPITFGELLREIIETNSGLFKYMDLLTFLNIQKISKATNLLPKSVGNKVTALVNEGVANNDVLNGAALGQKIQSDYSIRKQSMGEESQLTDSLRRLILSAESDSLEKVIAKSDTNETALLLRMLSPKKLIELSTKIDPEKMKDVIGIVNSPIKDLAPCANQLAENIEKEIAEYKYKIDFGNKLIFSLLDNVKIQDESHVTMLIDWTDVMFITKVIRRHFFYQHLEFIPIDILTKILASFEPNKRAEILILLESPLKDKIMNSFDENSKVKTMLESIITEITSNEKRHNELVKKKWDNLTRFMTVVNKFLKSNDETFDLVLNKILESYNGEQVSKEESEPEITSDTQLGDTNIA